MKLHCTGQYVFILVIIYSRILYYSCDIFCVVTIALFIYRALNYAHDSGGLQLKATSHESDTHCDESCFAVVV